MLVKTSFMPHMLLILALIGGFTSALSAVPFYWESKSEEPGFTIDIPSLWNRASRARDKVANVHFERRDRAGRVAVEVRSYSAENTEIDQLILQLRTRLAVKYDRVFLVKRKEVGFRKNVEKQVWSARVGKKNYTLTTAFVVSDDKVLQLVCVSPVNRKKEYEFVFDNALLSLDFSDGKPDGDGGGAEKGPAAAEAPAAAAAPAPAPAAPAATVTVPGAGGKPGVTVTAPAATMPAATVPAVPAAAKPKPPKIEF